MLTREMIPAHWGIGIGLAGAFALSRILRGRLFRVTPTDFATFAAGSLLLLVVAAPACYVPTKRATCIDPVQTPRLE